MESDDPWHWSIDRVVQELCTPHRSWQPPPSTTIPDFTEFANVLRQHEVTGSIFLLDIDDDVLRNDFNFKTLSKRAFIRRAIEELRLRSAQYRAHVERHFKHNISSSLNRSSTGGFYQAASVPGLDIILPYGQRNQVGRSSDLAVLPSPQSTEPFPHSLSAATSSEQLARDVWNIPILANDETGLEESVISEERKNKRRKLDLVNAANNLASINGDELPHQVTKREIEQQAQAHDPLQQSASTAMSEPAATLLPGLNEKKRKRIAPILISSEVDPARDRQIPTEADNVLHNNPENVEPGVPFVTDDGKKRVVPIHLASPDSESLYNYDDLLRKSGSYEKPAVDEASSQSSAVRKMDPKRDQKSKPLPLSQVAGYLGKQKMMVDDVFYEGIALGEELPTSEGATEFSVRPMEFPSGRRLYVHRIMKGFFRSEPKVFKRDGNFFSAVCPYPSKLAPRFHSPSFTLYYASDDGKILCRREEIPRWPEVDPDTTLQLPRNNWDGSRVTLDLEVLSKLGSYAETFDPDCLKKYQHIHGGDEVLPLYGESDEENEYDIDTWAEIEEEHGTLEKPLKPLRKPLLSLEDINQAIEEGITEMVTKWQKEKLPKMQLKAFRIWQKFRKNREARRDHIGRIQKHLDRINEDRIPKLRKEIAGEDWTSQLQVRKQTRIMEQSIFDRESSVWEMDVLKSSNAPEKPLRKACIPSSSKLAPPTEDCEEGESVGSDSAVSSSDDDMDDFIVQDTSSGTEQVEMNLADSEDEDGSVSSDSSLSTPTRKDNSVRSTAKQSPTKDVTSYDDLVLDGLDDVAESARPIDTAPRTLDGLSTPSAMMRHSVKEEPTIPDLHLASHSTADDPIDLTMLSSDDAPVIPVINLLTPRRKKPMVSLVHRGSPFSDSPISISDEEWSLPDIDNLPPYDDPDAIAEFPHKAWASVDDRVRLVISVVRGMDDVLMTGIFAFISSVSERELWCHMSDVIKALLDEESSLKGVDNTTFRTLVAFIRLFSIYVECKHQARRQPSHERLIKLDSQRAKWFPAFYHLCQKLEGYFSKSASTLRRDGDENNVAAAGDVLFSSAGRLQAVNVTSDDDDREPTSQHKKRKRKVYEDKEARDMREKDRLRLEEQEKRRKKLQKRLPTLAHAEGQHQIVINDGKFEHQGFVYVSKEIAPRIKQHQIEGVRFMWNQIVTDEKSMQGCLLAHTMGLGKTMQVITLLSAIAEASRSPDESVHSQVPLSLRTSKTLVLCPAGLIDNWMDELLTWAPQGLLGNFRKVDTTIKIFERLRTISEWYHHGGVLILGYEMFRHLYDNKKTTKREAPLSEEDHETVKDQLLEGPNIIVADEAHRMKNAKSGIAQSAAQFRSRSRIALTGSPLANNVAEYHTMIDWVAPNYLGPAVEFRAKYVEPIQEGLWNDSSAADRRKSLKMLGVLKQDLAPKVHRADMSVLRNDLPPKKEFVITVPLTDLQKKVYSLYVQSMVSGNAHTTKSGEFLPTTVWHWLAILSLLCNHPECFNKKLNERKEDARKELGTHKSGPSSRSGTDQEEAVAAELNAPVWKVGVSQELIVEVTRLFRQETNDLMAIDLSNKVKILCQILDASKEAGDKVLIFSQSLPTLDFLEELCITQRREYSRLDGSTTISKRQEATKAFNVGMAEVYLISTAAGGLGLNIFGANRVVIFDFKFNPIMEEQAVGRAYRIGQRKPVFVYRFVAGGTFEGCVHNKAVFKTQLASRVVDKKSPVAWARKRVKEFLFEPKEVEQEDLSEFIGMDPLVLDNILASQVHCSTIRGIVQTDTFERDDDDKLTAEEEKEVDQLLIDERLKRSDPKAWYGIIQKRNADERNRQMGLSKPTPSMRTNPGNHQLSAVSSAIKPTVPAPPLIASLSAASSASHPPILPPPAPFRTYSRVGSNVNALKPPLGIPSLVKPARAAADQTQIKSPTGAPHDISSNPPSSRRGRSPVVGGVFHARIRSVTPEDKSGPSLRMELPRRARSISPAIGKSTSPPLVTQTSSKTSFKNESRPDQRQRGPQGTSPAAQRKIEAVLTEVIKQSHEFSDTTSTPNLHQLSMSVMKALADNATESTIESVLEEAIVVLQNDKLKSQALATLKCSPDSFARGIIKSISAQSSSSSGGPGNIEEVSTSPSSPGSSTPTRSRLLLSDSCVEMVAGAKELRVVQPQHDLLDSRLSDSKLQKNQVRSPHLEPHDFKLLFNEELKEHLRRHALSDEGTRLELIARCKAGQAVTGSEVVESQ